jgi:GntR family transcriptional regulator, gluconate operon transcriptional repressor
MWERGCIMLSWDNSLSLGEQLANSLRMKIVSGELEGQKLSENIIANEYGASRAPVREAVRTLESEGLVHLTKQGIMIKGLAETDLQDFYDVRFMLETFALTHIPPELVPELADQLDVAADQMELAIVHHDSEEFAAKDARFHNLIFESIQHKFVKLFWNNIKDLSKSIIFIGTKKRFEQEKYDRDQQAALNHRLIAKALRTGDANQLRDALILHFSYYNGWIVKDKF